jgi:hypothetical protein
MNDFFDEHAARYLFFEAGEKVTVILSEKGAHALARISSAPGLNPSADSRSFAFSIPKDEAFLPIHVDAAFSGTLEDFLGSNSQIKVEFKGSKGTRYVQALRPQGGTGRWTYLVTIRQPNARWYFCSTPCKDWIPTKIKPKATHCPHCKTGIIIAVHF